MSYEIRQVDIRNIEIENQLRALIKEAFEMKDPIPPGYLYDNTFAEESSGESIFLAAFEDEEIIGCCGFMATDFINSGKVFTCYQAVWAATHPRHQKKKIFINLVDEGKKILKESGAGFLYALAGDSSHFIFVNRLGFREIPSVMVKIPNIPLLRGTYFRTYNDKKIDFYKTATYYPVEEQVIELKKNSGGEEVIKVQVKDSFLWGKIKTKQIKWGITLKYFYVGGLALNEIEDFKQLFDRVCGEFRIHYIQIVSCETNLYNFLLKNWRPTRMHGFIFYELNVPPVENVNIFYGAIDVF